MLDKLKGLYSEDPNTGNQRFTVNDLVDTSGAKLSCRRQRESRPFKRFGSKLVELPPSSSTPIQGGYYLGGGYTQPASWIKFTNDGFVLDRDASPGESHCQRTLANGMQLCHPYTYHGGNNIALTASYRETPIKIEENGEIRIDEIGHMTPINAPTANELFGKWRVTPVDKHHDIGKPRCYLGICNPSGVASRTLEFFSDGSFTSISRSKLKKYRTARRRRGYESGEILESKSGVYRLAGTGIQLHYEGGHISAPVFMHLLDAKTLALGDTIYKRVGFW